LRDAAAAGCAGEIELLAQRQEVTDLLHLHGYRLPFAGECNRPRPSRRSSDGRFLLHA
jgi:hypothetical protein